VLVYVAIVGMAGWPWGRNDGPIMAHAVSEGHQRLIAYELVVDSIQQRFKARIDDVG
jgi:hypothetical protein